MSSERPLPVIIPPVSKQRWSCHQCAQCCRTAVVHLFEADRGRIDEQDWSALLDVAPYVRVGRQYVLNERGDGACVFLDSDNHCRIHARFGEQAKPIACRMFPFSLRQVRDRWQASLRFDCPSVAKSEGVGLGEQRGWLERVAAELPRQVGPASPLVRFKRGRIASESELHALIEAIVRVLRDPSMALGQRLIGLARVTATLSRCNLAKVRDDRFAELVRLLFQALPSEADQPVGAATKQQGRLFRQLAFAYAEHVSLAELRLGLPRKLAIRMRQLRKARVFARGEGMVPMMGGFGGVVTFDDVDAVTPGSRDGGPIAEIMERYVSSRIAGDSVFGRGYYGWPVFAGLSALWMSLAVAGYVARFAAACDGRSMVACEDVVHAIGLVDRAATRSPALGVMAERARLQALLADDGVARLLHRYGPVLNGC